MTADMIIKGNAIFDSVSGKHFAGFVAVKGNRIAAVGKDMDSISQYAGADTKIIDAGDRLVMPGFQTAIHI